MTRVSVVRALLVALLALVGTPLGATLGAQGMRPVPRPAVGRVPVAARALARGEVLTAADIAFFADTVREVRERTRAAGAWGTTASAAPVGAGWVVRRAIAAGEPLRAPAVTPPDAVRYGQPVRVVYRESGLAITISGTAVADAPVGARVAVRVESAGRARRLEGTVLAPGLVQLN